MFKIIRYFNDERKSPKLIKKVATLKEAQEHCSDEFNHGAGWFDGYTNLTLRFPFRNARTIKILKI